jgi:serine phosphatase RsbU (regulator of sigma subunit)
MSPAGGLPPTVEIGERQLAAGDLLIFYSDGVIDCASPTGERLGERRMQRLVRELAEQPSGAGALRDRIERAIAEHARGAPLADDITLVVARVI